MVSSQVISVDAEMKLMLLVCRFVVATTYGSISRSIAAFLFEPKRHVFMIGTSFVGYMCDTPLTSFLSSVYSRMVQWSSVKRLTIVK